MRSSRDDMVIISRCTAALVLDIGCTTKVGVTWCAAKRPTGWSRTGRAYLGGRPFKGNEVAKFFRNNRRYFHWAPPFAVE